MRCWSGSGKRSSLDQDDSTPNNCMKIQEFVYTCSMIILVSTEFSACCGKVPVKTTSQNSKVHTPTHHIKPKYKDIKAGQRQAFRGRLFAQHICKFRPRPALFCAITQKK